MCQNKTGSCRWRRRPTVARKSGHCPAEEAMPEKKQFPQSQLEQSAKKKVGVRRVRVRFGHAMVFSYAAGSHFQREPARWSMIDDTQVASTFACASAAVPGQV